MNYPNRPILIGLILSLFIFGCTSKEVKKAKEFIDAAMYEQAITYLELEIQDNPKNAEASYLLGKCYMETDDYDYDQIKKCFDRAILLDSDYKEMIANIFFDKSLELYKEGDDYDAEDYYEEGLVYNPTYKIEFAQKLFDFTSEFSETSTDAGRSTELFEIVDEISPEYKSQIAEKSYVLAKTFIEKGFVDQGFKYADFGIGFDPKRIKDVAELYFAYGKELVDKLNKPYESIKYFEKYIKLSPDKRQELAKLFNELAKEYEKINEIELLLFFGNKSVEYDSDFKIWFTEIEKKYEPKFTDTRDGEVYKYVKTGNQVWMAENLRYKPSSGKYWAYDNNAANVAVYGYLYDWETAKKVCPAGWHLPTDAEWTQLIDYLGGESVAGGKLKETGTTHWNSPNTGATNESGFTALPGGVCGSGYAGHIGSNGYWWSATEGGTDDAWVRNMGYNRSSVPRFNYNKDPGFSVRCLRD